MEENKHPQIRKLEARLAEARKERDKLADEAKYEFDRAEKLSRHWQECSAQRVTLEEQLAETTRQRESALRYADGQQACAKMERELLLKAERFYTAMTELCAHLREHFESSGHPTCPDPECGELDGQHVPGCAYVKYVDAATAAA